MTSWFNKRNYFARLFWAQTIHLKKINYVIRICVLGMLFTWFPQATNTFAHRMCSCQKGGLAVDVRIPGEKLKVNEAVCAPSYLHLQFGFYAWLDGCTCRGEANWSTGRHKRHQKRTRAKQLERIEEHCVVAEEGHRKSARTRKTPQRGVILADPTDQASAKKIAPSRKIVMCNKLI